MTITCRVALAACLLLAARLGHGAPVDERAMKALLVINFAKFVEWPGASGSLQSPIVIGVLEPDPLGRTLDRLAGATTVGGRPILIRRFARPQEVSGVHVLYLGRDCADAASLAIERSGSGVLTVGETEDFIERGGIIRIFPAVDRLRFEVSSAAAARAGLKVNSQLLKLGTAVEPPKGKR